MQKVVHANRYEEWQPNYNWSNCATGRKDYGKFLISVLTEEQDGYVLNLNGAWGTGKTEFLRRLYIELAEQSYPVVYIDAWESDFLKDPFTVICTELLNQLGYMFENSEANKEHDLYKNLVKTTNGLLSNLNSVMGLIQTASDNYTIGQEYFDSDDLKLLTQIISLKKPNQVELKGVEETNSSILKKMVQQQNCLQESMIEIRKQIKTISFIMRDLYDYKTPTVILVDELDRCRPDYAVKMLEIIKHFFTVENCSFLVATDTKSLEASIRAVYGNDFDSDRYLRRFFDQRITLAKPSIYDYIVSKNIDYSKYENSGILFYPFGFSKKYNDLALSKLVSHEKLELRDIEQVIKKYTSSLNFITSNKPKNLDCLNTLVLLSGIIEHKINNENFEKSSNTNPNIAISTTPLPFTKNATILEVLNMQYATVSLAKSKRIHWANGGGRALSAATEMVAIRSVTADTYGKYQDGELKLYDIAIRQISGYEGDTKANYWLWEDYKKIIGLAAHIE